MMDMYKAYLEERTPGKSVYYNDYGFATYHINGEEVYIEDLYVKPEYRKEGIAASLADSIAVTAKAAGCKVMTGSVVPSAVNSTTSMKVLLAYGFRLHKSLDNFIIFVKDL